MVPAEDIPARLNLTGIADNSGTVVYSHLPVAANSRLVGDGPENRPAW